MKSSYYHYFPVIRNGEKAYGVLFSSNFHNVRYDECHETLKVINRYGKQYRYVNMTRITELETLVFIEQDSTCFYRKTREQQGFESSSLFSTTFVIRTAVIQLNDIAVQPIPFLVPTGYPQNCIEERFVSFFKDIDCSLLQIRQPLETSNENMIIAPGEKKDLNKNIILVEGDTICFYESDGDKRR